MPATQTDRSKDSRRLDDPHDYMHIEIESALARGIPVVPLLVGKATMPAEAHLPDGLKELAYRNAAEARSGREVRGQVDRLIRGLEQLLAKKARAKGAGVEKAIHIRRTKTPRWPSPRPHGCSSSWSAMSTNEGSTNRPAPDRWRA